MGKFGEATWTTSAPCSASVRALVGPANTRVRSRTRRSERGREPIFMGSGGASPIFIISTTGRLSNAFPCGCFTHSDEFLTTAPVRPRRINAASSSKESRRETACAIVETSASASIPSSTAIDGPSRNDLCR